MYRRLLFPISAFLLLFVALVCTGGREERRTSSPPGRVAIAAPPVAAPAPQAGELGPYIRELSSTPAIVWTGGNVDDIDLGADEERIHREAKAAAAELEAHVGTTGLPALFEEMCDAARADDGAGFDRMQLAFGWKIAKGSTDWGLVEGFALDPARPLVARKAVIAALAWARGSAASQVVLGWFRDPRFRELRPTLLCAVLRTGFDASENVLWDAEELFRHQARNAGFSGPAMESHIFGRPASPDRLDLVLGIVATEKATDCSLLAVSSLGAILSEARIRSDWGEGAAPLDAFIDPPTLARLEAVLLEVSLDAERGLDERVVALRAVEHLSPMEARSPRVVACLASLLRTDPDAGVRYVAAEQLRNLWPESRGLLEEARRDPDALVREMAERTLAELSVTERSE